jgi:type I restriction enzyme M protein
VSRKGKKSSRPSPRSAKSLKRLFSELHDHLYAQSNMSRNERLGKELLKIILAKYFDEKLGAGIFPDSQEDILPGAFSRSFKGFFDDTLSPRLVNSGVYSKNEAIGLDDRSIEFVGRVLAGHRFSDSPVDALGAAFEVFSEGSLIGDQGQFFTPIEIVRMAVEMLDPRPGDRVIDPACGSGGFINFATRWMAGKGKGKRTAKALKEDIHGIDKDSDLVEVARGFSLITGRSPDNILHMDTLSLLGDDPEGLLGSFDIVLTNPPFGSKIKIKDQGTLRNFDLGHKWTYDPDEGRWVMTSSLQEREPQILFIEVCMNLLKEGGRCAIVLPDGIFGNPTDEWVRQYILDNAEILAVVDCPHDTFMPGTHTKTSVLFFKKCKGPRKDHGIFMSIVEKCGHDSRGTTILDKKGNVDEEFSRVPGRFLKKGGRKRDRLGFRVKRKRLVENILVPRYYDPDLRATISSLEKSGDFELRSIGELEQEGVLSIRNAPSTVSKADYGKGNIPFIRTTDIGNGEILYPTTHTISEGSYKRFKDKQDLRVDDILLIKDGTYRVGRSVILLEEDIHCLVQSHFKIIRVAKNDILDPFVLYYLLQQPVVMKQIMLNTFVQATLSTIGKRLAKVVLPVPKDRKKRARISKKIEKGLLNRRRILQDIREMDLR